MVKIGIRNFQIFFSRFPLQLVWWRVSVVVVPPGSDLLVSDSLVWSGGVGGLLLSWCRGGESAFSALKSGPR